jgi:tetratricopeptide (TPR) repeat protein
VRPSAYAMAVVFSWFGRGLKLSRARKAELSADFASAIVLYSDAGVPDEAARVLCLRGDGELEPNARLMHYTQAASMAVEGGQVQRAARLKRATLLIGISAGSRASSGVARHDLLAAAKELEDLGEHARAREAYQLAGDHEGEARALEKAGEVDELESLLSSEADHQREARKSEAQVKQFEEQVGSGKRREAFEAIQERLRIDPSDEPVRRMKDGLLGRKLSGPIVSLSVGSRTRLAALGETVTVGRANATVNIASPALSREHLKIYRENGVCFALDLGSRNGTFVAGIALQGPIRIEGPLELRLGNEIPLRLLPSREFDGALELELGGDRVVASLGPLRLHVADWSLAERRDHWFELRAPEGQSLYQRGLALSGAITLLSDDAFSIDRDGPVAIRVSSLAGTPR